MKPAEQFPPKEGFEGNPLRAPRLPRALKTLDLSRREPRALGKARDVFLQYRELLGPDVCLWRGTKNLAEQSRRGHS